jgi:hypothetical protein
VAISDKASESITKKLIQNLSPILLSYRSLFLDQWDGNLEKYNVLNVEIEKFL